MFSPPVRTILKIVAIYVLIAVLWIALSDRAVLWLVHDVTKMTWVSTLKGWLFVLVTAVVLAALLLDALHHNLLSRARLNESEARFHGIFDAVSDAIFIHHPLSGKILDCNQRALDLYGYERDSLLALDVGQLSAGFLPYTAAEAKVRLLKVLTGGVQRFDWLAKQRDGSLFWVEVTLQQTRLNDHEVVVSMVHDIGERKRLEQSLRRRQAMYAVLSASNQAIIHATTRDELFNLVCHAMLKLGVFRLVWVGSPQSGLGARVVPLSYAGDAHDFLEELSGYTWNQLIEAGTPAGRAWQTRTHVIENDFARMENPLVLGSRVANVHGLCAAIAMPIAGGGFQGVLTAYANEVGFFDEDVVALMLDVAREVSFALRHLRDLERQNATMDRLKLFARVFDESRDGIMICDDSNQILMANRALCSMFGYEQDALLGQNPRMLRSGRHGPGFYREMWDELVREGCWQGEVWDRRQDGELLPCWAKIYIMRDEEGEVSHYFEVISDLSEYQAREELQWMKRFDLLTRLPNRVVLEEHVTAAIAHGLEHGHQAALLSINLDRFHYVNESLGHTAGDQVLKMMAERFSVVLDDQGLLSRLSGGAFVALLPELRSAQQAEELAVQLLRAASKVYELDGIKISQTTCIGIALFPHDGEDFQTLLRHADCARVEAAEGGGNHFRFYVHDLNERSRDRLSLSADLMQALEQDRFLLYYQPQVTAHDNAVIGVEALLRLQHATQGVVSPAEFIPLAEETGLIVPLGAWVIQQACRQMRHWQTLGLTTMSINLSPLQLQDPQLLTTIEQALADNQLSPSLIEFELTESALMRNSISTLNQLNRLKTLGVRLAIDDFGTGYSNLSYLKQFPVDRLKIDQSFVRGVADEVNDVAIVEAIVAVARAMGLDSIGEGVETQAQAAMLQRLGCDEFQGYLYSHPLPAAEFEAWLRTRMLLARHG